MTSLKNRKIIILRVLLLILIIVNCIVIFNYSGQVAKESAEVSTRTMYKIIKILSGSDDIEKAKQLDPLIRKLAHFFIYASLGIWSCCFLCTFFSNKDEKIKDKMRISIAIIFGFLYACSDEIHQIFVDGRACKLIDIVIDTLGVAIGVLTVIAILKIIEKRNNIKWKGNK